MPSMAFSILTWQPSLDLSAHAQDPSDNSTGRKKKSEVGEGDRRVSQTERQVEHVVLLVRRLLDPVVELLREDDVACRAGDRAFAGAYHRT
jgi:hypothetical protein